MSPSTHSSDRSASYPTATEDRVAAPAPVAGVRRFQWRPSRWMMFALLLLAVLAPLAIIDSALPRAVAWPAAVAALAHGAWLARREWSQSGRLLVVPTGLDPVTLDGKALDEVQVHWRGPLAFVRWRRDRNRSGHLAWWPDILPAGQRRELKLAMQAREAARPPGTMAP